MELGFLYQLISTYDHLILHYRDNKKHASNVLSASDIAYAVGGGG